MKNTDDKPHVRGGMPGVVIAGLDTSATSWVKWDTTYSVPTGTPLILRDQVDAWVTCYQSITVYSKGDKATLTPVFQPTLPFTGGSAATTWILLGCGLGTVALIGMALVRRRKAVTA